MIALVAAAWADERALPTVEMAGVPVAPRVEEGRVPCVSDEVISDTFRVPFLEAIGRRVGVVRPRIIGACSDSRLVAVHEGPGVWLVERHDLPLVRAELSFDVAPLRLGPGALDALGAAWGEEAERAGGDVELGCDTVQCWATAWAPKEELRATIAAMGRLVRAPELSAASIARWRRTAGADWRTDAASPDRVHARALGRALWPDGGPLREDREVRDFRVTVGEVREAWSTVVTRATTNITIVGDARSEELRSALGWEFEMLRGPTLRVALGDETIERTHDEIYPPLPAPRLARPLRLAVSGPDSPQAEITVAWSAPDAADAGRPAWALAFRVLAGSFTSRLNARLREADGLTYGVSGESALADAGAWARIDVSVDAKRLGDALVAIEEELDRLRNGGVTEVERAAAVQGTWRDMEREASTGDGLAYWIWRDASAGRTPLAEMIHAGVYQDVSLAEIRREARRWLGVSRTWVVTAPEEILETELPRVGWTADRRWTACEAVYGAKCRWE